MASAPNESGLQPAVEELSAWMRGAFALAFPEARAAFADVAVVPAVDPEFGDYQCNNAMGLAKTLRRPPRAIAEAAVAACPLPPSLESADVAGPGFINLRLSDQWLSERLNATSGDPRLGVPRVGQGKTVVIDYSSPNVAKPMHIGHIRSTIIGNAIDRMHRFLGYRVVADNHIGDWGTQFGIMIQGYKHFLDEHNLERHPVEELERVYVKSYERGKDDGEWMDRCRAELVKLQSGDPESRALWEQFIRLSLEEFARIYNRLGVSFELTRGESYYHDRLAPLVQRLQDLGLARESEGALVVFLDEEKLPPCIVRKRDGGFNYATTDLATIESRVEDFAPAKIIYVTDERQQNHFRQIFAIVRKLGVATDLEHVWFGLMRLPTATFSTRQGNVIRLERLLDEAESRALRIVEEASPDMPEEQRLEIARMVGIGAVKYADLSQSPQTTVTFTWEKAMALDGNSGPYLQYAHARIASVRRKYADRFPGQDPDRTAIAFSEPIERSLAVKLLRFPEVVIKAAEQYKPSFLAEYLYDLAQTYSTFYQNVPFLKAEEGVRESRVRLCSLVAAVLGKGLDLLGIEAPERI